MVTKRRSDHKKTNIEKVTKHSMNVFLDVMSVFFFFLFFENIRRKKRREYKDVIKHILLLNFSSLTHEYLFAIQ